MPSQGSPGPEPGAGLLRPGQDGDSPSGFSHIPSSQKGHLLLARLHPAKSLPSPQPRIQVGIAFKTKVKATSQRTPCYPTALGLRAAQLTMKSEGAGLFKPSLGGEPSLGRPAEPARVKPPCHQPPPQCLVLGGRAAQLWRLEGPPGSPHQPPSSHVFGRRTQSTEPLGDLASPVPGVGWRSQDDVSPVGPTCPCGRQVTQGGKARVHFDGTGSP